METRYISIREVKPRKRSAFYFKVGGLRFIRLGRLSVSFCITKKG